MKLVKFESEIKPRILELGSVKKIAWCLRTTEGEVDSWEYRVPLVWSQYFRESGKLGKQITRRRIKTINAAAHFHGLIDMYETLGLPLRYKEMWLPEYHSLLLEYSTKGAIKGTPIVSQDGNVAVPLDELSRV